MVVSVLSIPDGVVHLERVSSAITFFRHGLAYARASGIEGPAQMLAAPKAGELSRLVIIVLGVTCMWLLHGTTRTRAESIVQHGPNVAFVEPGGQGIAENFSFTAADTTSAVGEMGVARERDPRCTVSPSQTTRDRLRLAFAPTQDGIVGLTNQLLDACAGSEVEFKRIGDHCVCNWTVGGETEEAPVPLPPAAFRTILARIAALCNEGSPSSVSPYGGKGLLAVKGPPPALLCVAFVNTPDEQRLEVRSEKMSERVTASPGEVPIRPRLKPVRGSSEN
jgi:hypothetical protein